MTASTTLLRPPINGLSGPLTPELPVSPRHGLRRLVGRLAIGLAGTYLLDQEIGHRTRWRQPKPTITERPAEPGASPETAILVTAGFNSRPEATADPLQNVFAGYGRVALFHDSHAGLSLRDNLASIATWAKETRTKNLVMYGPSMGTLLNVAVAPQLKHDENLNLFLLIDSSPFSFKDVKGASRRATVRTLAHMGLRGGPLTRIALETVGYGVDHASDSNGPFAGLTHAIHKLQHPSIQSNSQCIDRARLLLNADPAPQLAQLAGVPAVYMSAADPKRDKVVDILTALPAYQAVYPGDVNHFVHPETGHANPANHPQAYREMTAAALESFELPLAA